MPAQDGQLLCPSAPPQDPGARVFGVVKRDSGVARVSYLETSAPVTEALLAHAEPVSPRQVMRFAAPCQEHRCIHFDGAACSLGARIVERLEAASLRPPPCSIRKSCRWFGEQGRDACLRCPQVVTETEVVATDPVLLAGAGAD